MSMSLLTIQVGATRAVGLTTVSAMRCGAAGDVIDDFGLMAAKGRVAEDVVEKREGLRLS